MIRNHILAKSFLTLNRLDEVTADFNRFSMLSDFEKEQIEKEYTLIINTETPHLALKRHGIIPPDNWEEVLNQLNARSKEFFDAHPYFSIRHIRNELLSLINSVKATFKNEFRKGRENIRVINVLRNDDYLVFVYNRRVNSTQTDVVFSGVPLKAIDELEDFSFLKKHIPPVIHNFTIEKKTYAGNERCGIDNYIFYYLICFEDN